MEPSTDLSASSPPVEPYMSSSDPSDPGNNDLSVVQSRSSCNEFLLSHVYVEDDILIWWPFERRYYLGYVAEELEGGFYRIKYDDGFTEIVLLRAVQWRFYGDAEERVLEAYKHELLMLRGIPFREALMRAMVLGAEGAEEIVLGNGSEDDDAMDVGNAADVEMDCEDAEDEILDGGNADDMLLGGEYVEEVVLAEGRN